MLNFEKTLDQLAGLTLLRFFPSDPGARLELAKLVSRMAATEDQVDWLVQRTLALCSEWPGPLVLRQILCSKFKPADGISAGGSPMFPDGVPSERRIDAPVLPALPPGHVATVDRGLDNAVKMLADVKDMNRVMRRNAPVQETPTHTNFKPITQADIDRAVNELHEKRARAELGNMSHDN